MSYKIPITKADFENVYKKDETLDNTKSKQKDEILKNLQALKDLNGKTAWDFASEPFEYEFLKQDNTTDEQISKLVNDAFSLNNESAKQQLTEENEQKKQALYSKAEKQKDSYENDKKDIANAYENAKRGAGNDAIKRGIARSSIIVNMLKDYDFGKISALNERSNDYKQEIADIEENIVKLDQKLKDSLKQMDMQTAVQMNEQIQELKKKRDETNEKVIKYNNELTKALNNNKLDYMNSSAMKEIIDENNKKRDELKEKIAYDLIDYYKGLSLEEALKDFNESKYEDSLDAKQIMLIKNYLNQRKN